LKGSRTYLNEDQLVIKVDFNMITEDNKGEYNLTVTLGDEVTPRGI